MYGKESYLTTNALVSSWDTAPKGAWAAGTGYVANSNGYAGAAVTWTASTATTNALIHTTDKLGFTSGESTE
jgi:hypothetical protein